MKETTRHTGTVLNSRKDKESNEKNVPRESDNLSQKILESVPDAYLVLSPDLKVQLVTDAYLAATHIRRDEVVGKYVFDVFPDNPAYPEPSAVQQLRVSFNKLLSTKQPDQMLPLQYDIPRPAHMGGGFEEKYWSPFNTPVLNEAGEVAYIIHKITDVTELVRSQDKSKEQPYEHHVLQAALDQLHKIQQMLKEEQRRLEETQTIGHIGSFEAVYPYEFIHWSDELYRIHGLVPQREQITFGRYKDFIHPDDREIFENTLEEFYRKKKELDFIYRIIGQEGGKRVLHTKGEILCNAEGTPVKVVGTVQDITEQVKTQQKVKESERLLHEAEKVGHFGSYYCDIASFSFHFSEGLFRLLGYEPDAFVPTLEIVDAASHPDDVPVVRQILEQAAKDKQHYEYERRVFLPDGELRYMHSKGRVQCDKEGNAVKYIGIVQDVTEQKLAEEKLRESERHFRTLVDNTPDVITRWEKEGRLVFHNNVFQDKTGMPVASLYLQEDCETEKAEGASMSWKEKVKLVFRTGEMQDHYSSCETPDGAVYYHSRLMPEFAEDGAVQSVLVIARDISAMKELEQENLELRLSQQKELLLTIMETQETERRRVAEALHNGIGQLLYGAKLNLDQLTREEVTKDAQKIKASVLKTDQVLEQAINQVRSISHELTPSVLEHFGLEVAFKQICVPFDSKALEFQCIALNLKSKLEMHLQVSVYRMAQELANNVVKHAQATEASLLLREQKGSLVLLAEDNGKGFDPEQVQTQGIGIKSIQDRVKLLNGTMRILSAPGQGTLIQIVLPLSA